MGLSFQRDRELEVPCHRRYGTIIIPPWLKSQIVAKMLLLADIFFLKIFVVYAACYTVLPMLMFSVTTVV